MTIRFEEKCLLILISGQAITIRVRSLLDIIRNLLFNLNLFKRSSRNIETVHRQRILTRLFLVCLVVSLVIYSLFAFVSTQTKTITVSNPSRADFNRLWQIHSDSLSCPCSQIDIPYSDFIELVPIFHQVCSSRIISPEWYNRMTRVNRTLLITRTQFESALGSNYFQVLATFCSLTQNTIGDAYRLFSANKFISNRVIPETLFSVQVASLIDAFTGSTNTEFIRIFSLARSTTQSNQLISRTFSNFQLSVSTNGQVSIIDNSMPYLYPGFPVGNLAQCWCVSQGSQCGWRMYVYNSSQNLNLVYLTNLAMRCLPTESALTSTLECWYNNTCFGAVLAAYAREGVPDIVDIMPLDANVPSRFPRNATVQVMMNELLLENWTVTVSYEQFYNGCAPLFCIYTTEQRFDWFYVIVTILGVYSGLSTGLKLILPIIVRLALFVLRRIRMRCGYLNHSTPNAESIECNGK